MKPILSICLCFLSLSSFCQVKVGVQAGYNLTTLHGEDQNGESDYFYHASSKSAFNAGIISSIPLSRRLYLQPSLLLSEKGAKERTGGGWGPLYYTHLRLYYAHLPVQLMYTFINKKQWQLSAGVGGFISRGLWGNSKWSSERYDSTGLYYSMQGTGKVNFTNDLYNYDSDKRNIKSWDYGYTVAAAASWQSWQLKASYDFGAVKVLQFSDHRTGVFSLSAGYYFSNKKGKHTEK